MDRYLRTNHGRSLTAVEAGAEWERGGWIHSPADDLRYRVEVGNGRAIQTEQLLADDGEVVHELAMEPDLAIGSGNQTRSYLAIREGHVTQMPLTWYSVQGEWQMSPGYAEANDRFSRPLILQCLTCHSDLPVLEPHTQGVYEELPGAISCERCHGPGREHAEARQRGRSPSAGAPDPWIVNPTDLDREEEMSSCLQCHLAGVITYPDGEDPTTFRPGMHLGDNRAVHVPSLQLEDPDWVGIDSHPIRLARSACFEATEMTCLTCHLSHTSGDELPSDHYRNQCVNCHTGEDGAGTPGPNPLCSRPGTATAEEARSGDCVSCHLSAGGTSDVPHVRFTDHWIQREPGPPLNPDAGRPVIDSPEPLRLVEVGPLGREVDPSTFRHRSEARAGALRADALFHFYETMHRHPGYLPEVVSVGREARAAEGDLTRGGRLALARALLEEGEVDEAEELLRIAVDRAPQDPWGHFLLGALLDERRGDPGAALPHLDEAVRTQPRLGEARVKRAEVLYALGRRGEAREELEGVVADNPIHRPASWFNLGIVRMESGDFAGAEAAFSEASGLDPFHGDAAVQLGSIRMEAGDLDEAERAFRLAVTGDPENPAAHGSLALVHLERGRVSEARRSLERVLELDPGHTGARELLRQLQP
jgi:tetratricopeptide (TPR) repeat protein